MAKAKNINEYVKNAPLASQKLLKQIRAVVKMTAPAAEEVISYSIPAFRLNERILLYFAGWRDHVSIYPVPKGSAAMQKQISRYQTGRGTLRFSLDKPLPVNFISKIVRLRIKENTRHIKPKKKVI